MILSATEQQYSLFLYVLNCNMKKINIIYHSKE